MVVLHNLELHLSHACNLRCINCSHFSDLNLKGFLSVQTADDWMGLWSGRLRPHRFTLLGGEPTLNPDLSSIVRLARRHWPASKTYYERILPSSPSGFAWRVGGFTLPAFDFNSSQQRGI